MSLRTPVTALLVISGMLLAGCAAAAATRPTVAQTSAESAASPGPARPLPAGAGATLTQAPADALPSGWRTYTDPVMGYSISLPPGVDLAAGTSPAGIYTARAQFALPGVPGYQGMVLRIEPNPGGQGIEAILARLYQLATQEQAPADLAGQAQALTVSGLTAVRAVPGGSADEGDYTVVIPYRDKVYMLAPVHDLPYSAIAPEAQALFDQVLASFQVKQ